MTGAPDDFERMWADLAPVGRSASTRGYRRQPFTSAEREAHAWFVEQAAARGLRVEVDPVGNTVAWWEPDGVRGPAVLTGSHLDSVVEGGAFDGPLGVVSALAAVDRLRERGVAPTRRLGVSVFVEEEGSRFGVACLGSRLATGATSWDDARALSDPDGVRLGDVVAGPDQHTSGPWDLTDVAVFVELHVEQGRGLDRLDGDAAAVGVATGIWPHGRYRLDVEGRADHAGTTRMEDRADPMLTHAMTVLAVNKQARLSGQRATVGRVVVEPNGTNAVPSRVTSWIDARADSEEALTALVGEIERQATDRAGRDGTTARLRAESVSGAVAFDAGLGARLAPGRPALATQAGHDAGVLAAAGVPTAMLFVRNPTGVSHSPDEHAGTADCLAGVDVLADALGTLLTDPAPDDVDG